VSNPKIVVILMFVAGVWFVAGVCWGALGVLTFQTFDARCDLVRVEQPADE